MPSVINPSSQGVRAAFVQTPRSELRDKNLGPWSGDRGLKF
jgi:hypothetical protein